MTLESYHFLARDIEELIRQFGLALQVAGSQLTDFTVGSTNWTLARAIAGVNQEQELNLEEVARAASIIQAVGSQLDRLAADYGVARIQGGLASGSVLVRSYEATVLADNTILTNADQGLQFIVTNGPYTLGGPIDLAVSVRATRPGSAYNLEPGTALYSTQFPRLNIVVGTHRTPSGEICNGLTKGLNEEGDEDLRTRLLSTIQNLRATTDNAILTRLKAYEFIEGASIQVPLPGSIWLWLDSPRTITAEELASITGIVRATRSAGIQVSIRQATRRAVSVVYSINHDRSKDLDEISRLVVETTRTYIDQLDVGQTLFVGELVRRVRQLDGVLSVNLISPTADINPAFQEVLRTVDVDITYDVF